MYLIDIMGRLEEGASWSLSYGSWICNYYISLLNVVSSNPAHGDVHSIQHCVIKYVSDLRKSVVFSGYSDFLHQ